jgi:hypothetical protein
MLSAVMFFCSIVFGQSLVLSSASRRAFNDSGILFLQKYARQYSLTDTFFFDKLKSQLRYPKSSLNTTVQDTYETRKHSQHSYYGTGHRTIEVVLNIRSNEQRYL